MPPYLAPPYFSLSRLPITTKVGLTCFNAMILGALAFAAFVIFNERTHFDPERTYDNFRGSDWRSETEQEELFKQGRYAAEKSPRERYDIIHPHSFLMPILFFILLHMMEMTRGPRALKIVLYVVAFAATVVVIAAPWLVHRGRAWAPVLVGAVIGQLGTYAVMIAVPTIQMWFGGDQSSAAVAQRN